MSRVQRWNVTIKNWLRSMFKIWTKNGSVRSVATVLALTVGYCSCRWYFYDLCYIKSVMLIFHRAHVWFIRQIYNQSERRRTGRHFVHVLDNEVVERRRRKICKNKKYQRVHRSDKSFIAYDCWWQIECHS
jgi:hypothetical protein